MIDSLLANLHMLRPPEFWNRLILNERQYFVLTLHRPSNVDDGVRLHSTLSAIIEACRGFPVVFPVHPRTAAVLRTISTLPPSLKLVEPQPYLEFNFLVKGAQAVLTDSGGVTEEATVLGAPCLTLRNTTERPETVTIGSNELIGTDPRMLKPALDRIFAGRWKTGGIPDKWDGKAGERIAKVLEHLLTQSP